MPFGFTSADGLTNLSMAKDMDGRPLSISFPCQGRSKIRPVGRSKSRPVVGSQVVEYSGEEGRWSVAEAALLPRGAFGGRVSVRRMGDVCGGSA